MTKSIVVATDNIDATQALYVDGVLMCHEDTIYFSILTEHVESGESVTLAELSVGIPEGGEFPSTLGELLELQRRIAECE